MAVGSIGCALRTINFYVAIPCLLPCRVGARSAPYKSAQLLAERYILFGLSIDKCNLSTCD